MSEQRSLAEYFQFQDLPFPAAFFYRMRDGQMTASEFLLWQVVNGYAGSAFRSQGCTLTNQEIAELIGVCQKRVSQIVSKMIRDGVLRSVLVSNCQRRLYALHIAYQDQPGYRANPAAFPGGG